MFRKFAGLFVVGVSALLLGCGGMAVYKAEPLASSSRDDALRGVPFYARVPKLKVTKYFDSGGGVVLETSEPIVAVDYSTVFVVEGKRNWLNPFETLEFGATVHSDGTLASGTYKRDPQLDEAVSAAAAGATAAAGFVSDSVLQSLLAGKQVEKVVVEYR